MIFKIDESIICSKLVIYNSNEIIIKLVLIRHGESEWNLENKFTGWTDVDLSETGKKEAYNAGKILLNKG